jgi:hypothetical protein
VGSTSAGSSGTCTTESQPIVVDGGVKVDPRKILKCVRRVVFLSVPHWGTNIADWVHSHGLWREAIVAELRAAVAGSQLLLLDRIENSIAGGAACLTGAELLRAVQDALGEANEHNGRQSPVRKAEAHEAASELGLYLRHMASEFRAIDDLTSCPGRAGKPVSPARADKGIAKKPSFHLSKGNFLKEAKKLGRSLLCCLA